MPALNTFLLFEKPVGTEGEQTLPFLRQLTFPQQREEILENTTKKHPEHSLPGCSL